MLHSRIVRLLAGAALAPLAAITSLSTAATTAQAATDVSVCSRGCTFTTVSAAVAAASSGEVINVRAGKYAGGFIVATPVVIRGAGPGRTVIAGGADNLGTVLEIRANPVTITGVTITGGAWTSGSGLVGGGVVTDPGAVLNLTDCAVSANQGNTTGGGAGVNDYGTTNLSFCRVSDNHAGTATDPGQGGGIHVGASGTMTVNASVVDSNAAGWGGGVDIDHGGSVTLSRSVVLWNTSVHQGGGLDSNGSLTIKESLIVGNASGQGGGIMNNGPAELTNSWIFGNVSSGGAGSGGGVYVTSGNTLTTQSTPIVNNKPDNLVQA